MVNSLLEALIVIGPLLGSIAYVTIAERKIMGSMQRRVGPNKVGQQNLIRLNQIKRSYHGSSINNNNKHPFAIEFLYKDRVAPVKIFDSNIIATCFNLLDLEQRKLFLKEWENKGGIYLIQYKFDKHVFYIGRTNNFSARFKSHIKHKLTDRFHLFAKLVGWENFEFSIIEECPLKIQGERENFYLQNYLPLLNSNFISNHSEISIYNSLYDELKTKQPDLELNNTNEISTYVYKYIGTQIEEDYQYYNSINTLSNTINVSRFTIKIYLNTNVPYKGLLFFTKPIKDLDLLYENVKNSITGLNLNQNIAKEVWIYSIASNGNISSQKIDSREKVAKYFNISTKLLRYHMDNWKSGGINGNYFFSKELNEKEVLNLIELSSQDIKNLKISVWVYNSINMELIGDSFQSMQKTAEFFNVDYRTIQRHLNTNLVTRQNGQLILLFSRELNENDKKELLDNIKKAKNTITPIWVYNKINDELILIDNNKPTYVSKLKASKALGISTKTISKILNTNISYKDLFFFSERQC